MKKTFRVLKTFVGAIRVSDQMVLISQALEVVIAIIIFVGLVLIFFNVFGSTECDRFANATAVDLSNTISKVALEDGVAPWTGQGIPDDIKTNNYATVPIRLCERSALGAVSALFTAQSPTYILTYETFPEGGIAWSESQPFSGGALQSVFNYEEMKYFTKIITFGGSLAVKLTKWAWGKVISVIYKGGWDLLKLRFMKFLQNHEENRVARFFLNRWFASEAGTVVQKDIVDKQLDKSLYICKGCKDTLSEVTNMMAKNNLDKEDALIASVGLGTITEVENGLPVEKIVVAPEYRKFVSFWMENSGDSGAALRDRLYIPGRWGVDYIKRMVYIPVKNKISLALQKVKDKFLPLTTFFGNVKTKFNKYFNYNKYIDSNSFVLEEGKLKEILLSNPEITLGEMRDDPDFFIPLVNSIYQNKGINKFVEKAEEFSQEDARLVLNNYENYYLTAWAAKYIPKEQEELSGPAIKYITDQQKALMETLDNAPTLHDQQLALQELQNFFGKNSEGMTIAEQRSLTLKVAAGFTDLNDVPWSQTANTMTDKEVMASYNYLRGTALKAGILRDVTWEDSNGVIARAGLMLDKADEIGAEASVVKYQFPNYFYQRQTKPLGDFILPTITEDSISHETFAKFLTWAKGRAKRGVLLDLNRVGVQLYDPITGKIPLSISAYDLPPFSASPYSIKEGLKKSSAIQEGGCARQSICKIERGKATGATETSTAYLLDRQVNESTTVKLWRPRPYFPDRIPININTVLFYFSVPENPRFHVISPCFATAKVWKDKNTDTVFVDIEKGRKCNVSSCEQPNVTITVPSSITMPAIGLGGIGLPSFNVPIPIFGGMSGTFGPSSEDTPNYCYADEQYIWGADSGTGGDNPNIFSHMALFGSVTATCAIATSVATEGIGTADAVRKCIKVGEYADVAALFVEAKQATDAFTGPSYKRQETGWGYWNFQKAGDICDLEDMIASIIGTYNPAKTGQETTDTITKVSKLEKLKDWLRTSAKSALKPSSHFSIGDICYGLTLMGDTTLAWPIKTTVTGIIGKAATLNEKCMQQSAAQCAWIAKCYADRPDCNPGLWCDKGVNECKQGCISDTECPGQHCYAHKCG
jgi:hypothetical protein